VANGLRSFCEQGTDAALVPFASRIARDLGPFLLSASEDTLLLVLEAISSVLRIDKASWLDVELANALVLAILQVWNKNIKGEPRTRVFFFSLNTFQPRSYLHFYSYRHYGSFDIFSRQRY
jgi:hypothetical protein